MSKLVVNRVSISLDGYGAGPSQSLAEPMGLGGMALHQWVFATATWAARQGETGGEVGIDNDFATRGDDGVGATIMGRNMFGPVRGRWEDSDEWRGWWGEQGPFRHPVFVLTDHERAPLTLDDGTVFHFVTDGIESALAQAKTAAGAQDVRLGGGMSTIRQYLKAQLIDEMHLVQTPNLLGSGERLFDGVMPADFNLVCTDMISTSAVTHLIFQRTS
jgi:dihydrofolate reductase